MISVLLDELRSEDPSVREKALYAIADSGPMAATADILAEISRLLATDPNRWVRHAAARAIGCLGQPAATPELYSLLLAIVRDDEEDHMLKMMAARALGEIKAATAEAALALARFGDWAAIEALRKLGPAAATPEVISTLACLLERDDESYGFYSLITETLAEMGQAAAKPEVISAIIAAARRSCLRWDFGAVMLEHLEEIITAAGPEALARAKAVFEQAIEDAEFSMASALLAGIKPLWVDIEVPQIARRAIRRAAMAGGGKDGD